MIDHVSFAGRPQEGRNGRRSLRRRGHAVIVVAIMLPVLMGVAAMAIDVGYLYVVRQELQTAADAGAHAAAWTIVDRHGEATPDFAVAQATAVAELNSVGGSVEVTFGWVEDLFDPLSPFVLAVPDAANAVRVSVHRTSKTSNPVELFFAGVFGLNQTDVTASAVSGVAPAFAVYCVPVALPAPGFGPIRPDIEEANPGKDGPSEPLDGEAFQIGEQVTVFVFGEGKKSAVHLLLDASEVLGETQLGKVLSGKAPPVVLAVGDEFDVRGDGTGHRKLGRDLAKRLDDDLDAANVTVIMSVVEILPDTRNFDGELDGDVRVIDFLAVRLDGIIEVVVPDPDDPQDWSKAIEIELLVGTVVTTVRSGRSGTEGSGVVECPSVGIPVLYR